MRWRHDGGAEDEVMLSRSLCAACYPIANTTENIGPERTAKQQNEHTIEQNYYDWNYKQ